MRIMQNTYVYTHIKKFVLIVTMWHGMCTGWGGGGGLIKSTLGMIQFSSSDSTLANRGHMGAKHIPFNT